MPTPGPRYSGWHYDPQNARLDFYFLGTRVGHIDASGIRLASGLILNTSDGSTARAAGDVHAADLGANLKTGFIPLPLTSFRLIASNDIAAKNAADGGLISLDTDPTLKRVNAATDRLLRIAWAATSVVPITAAFPYPPDLDDTAAVIVNLIVGKNTNTDTAAKLTVGYNEAVGAVDAGGDTAAITETTGQNLKTVTIAAAAVSAYPQTAAITITPGTHGTDAQYLYGAYITYTRKT